MASVQEIAELLEVGVFEVLQNADQYAPLQRKSKGLMQFASMMTGLIDAAEAPRLTSCSMSCSMSPATAGCSRPRGLPARPASKTSRS